MKTVTAMLLTVAIFALSFYIASDGGRNFGQYKELKTIRAPLDTPQFVSAPAPASTILTNPLVLSLPVSHGSMTETFASWKDMQAAEQRLDAR
jgi:hypothetical protein